MSCSVFADKVCLFCFPLSEIRCTHSCCFIRFEELLSPSIVSTIIRSEQYKVTEQAVELYTALMKSMSARKLFVWDGLLTLNFNTTVGSKLFDIAKRRSDRKSLFDRILDCLVIGYLNCNSESVIQVFNYSYVHPESVWNKILTFYFHQSFGI
jgi:hypothetical protein